MPHFILAVAIALFLCPGGRAAEPGTAAPTLTLAEADDRLSVAERMLEGGINDRARDLSVSVLLHPDSQAIDASASDTAEWLKRREKARFIHSRALYGLSKTREQFMELANEFMQLSNNRYRLAESAYAVQSAYWAGRCYERAGEYQMAADQYARVGGLSLPQGMEGDAAQRMSRCLRLIAEDIPYPGTMRDRQRRDMILNQAIGELDRARLAFPVGDRRRGIELDLIALRLARRGEQFVREAATEAEAFIDSDPNRDVHRARAFLYRGRAASMLGEPEKAAEWLRRMLAEENPSDEDRREGEVALALALVELANSRDADGKKTLLEGAAASLEKALAGAEDAGALDGARIVNAEVLIELGRPSAALESLGPVLSSDRVAHRAWEAAGRAELARGRLTEAVGYLYPVTRPSNPSLRSRYLASRDASRAAFAMNDYGLALALNHNASATLRRDRLFSSLLQSEFLAMEINMKLGKMSGHVSLSGDLDLLGARTDAPIAGIEEKRLRAASELTASLGRLLVTGGSPDHGYDLAVSMVSADAWAEDGVAMLELAIAMNRHLQKRQPPGVTDTALSSRLGEAKQALALARAERILAAAEPSETDIDQALAGFAEASESYRDASSGGVSSRDSLDQGVVSMESGAFLMRLADKWNRGQWSGRSLQWREEARQRIEASLRPFNQTIASSGPSSLAARRARWARGRALSLLGEWRGAAADFLSLMNNSELPRVLRAGAARNWAESMRKLGETRQAMARLAVFADTDAESALLMGKLAEEAEYYREAYERFLFASNPESPSLPPNTPWRTQEAAYRAGKLLLERPTEVAPLLTREEAVESGRELLERSARENLGGDWARPMLLLLGQNLIGDGADGWRRAYRLAASIIELPGTYVGLDRSMYMLAAKAMAAGGDYEQALAELDDARDLLDDSPEARSDTAFVTLETARVYRLQGRTQDALRAYADVFAVYPDIEDGAEAARTEAARMLLSLPDAGESEREQARSILSGLRDQAVADRLLREHGMR